MYKICSNRYPGCSGFLLFSKFYLGDRKVFRCPHSIHSIMGSDAQDGVQRAYSLDSNVKTEKFFRPHCFLAILECVSEDIFMTASKSRSLSRLFLKSDKRNSGLGSTLRLKLTFFAPAIIWPFKSCSF